MAASAAIVLMPWIATSTRPGAAPGLAKASVIGDIHLRTGIGLALSSSARKALSSKARAASVSTSRDCAWAVPVATPAARRRGGEESVHLRQDLTGPAGKVATRPSLRPGFRCRSGEDVGGVNVTRSSNGRFWNRLGSRRLEDRRLPVGAPSRGGSGAGRRSWRAPDGVNRALRS